ncbi:TetR/AcrR family transcriptional regulator [Actinomadura rugatobispora]|uniref:TetR/AcrR family transcriptional regulator n=1 Tax=Actinomadura rugatobispora TaxID=1994 RepID=A0ABW0ZWY7_9ACTN|nr:TetR/AcrR family transcriptional regulator [Actinomadura rugatobispora]
MTSPRQPTGRRRLPTGERRAQLVDIASRLFRERGYHHVGMRDIADAADIKSASLYHHFRSKTDLLQAIVESVSEDLIASQEPFARAARDEGRSGGELLAALLRRQIVYLCEHADALWVADREINSLPSEVIAKVQRSRRRYQRTIAALIADGVRTGELRSSAPDLVAFAALDMVNGLSRWYRPERGRSLENVADGYVALIIKDLLGGRLEPGG